MWQGFVNPPPGDAGKVTIPAKIVANVAAGGAAVNQIGSGTAGVRLQ
jgi:hypothetical protein